VKFRWELEPTHDVIIKFGSILIKVVKQLMVVRSIDLELDHRPLDQVF
jgi:hypothetical protein